MEITAPYGTWDTPVTAELVASGSSSIAGLMVDTDGATYWTESRPTNKGRHTLVRRDLSGAIQDVTPEDFSVRTFVHEYGGGAFTVHAGNVYASNATDSALYEIIPGKPPRRITFANTIELYEGKPSWRGVRFADLTWTPHGLIAVAEKHTPGASVENFLALIDIVTGEYRKIASGHDFFATPALSANFDKIAWICWDHPNMPWDHTELWTAEINSDGTLRNSKRIAGIPSESILQPQWSPDGTLYFISDRDKGWWNLHRYVGEKTVNICPMDAEVGEPLWIFGRSTYAFVGDQIFFAYTRNSTWNLASLNTGTLKLTQIPRTAASIQYLRSTKNGIQYLEGYPDANEAIVAIENTPSFPSKVLYQRPSIIGKEYISTPEFLHFPSEGRQAYGNLYLPKNPNYKGPKGELPPLVVMIHGGPTSQARTTLQPRHQFWTTRGFALLDVNYGGSTGFGRSYRDLLKGQWGVVDVDDCVNGARHIVSRGLADPKRLVIRGGSSGGYTTLAALAFKDEFVAGADYYGVADLTVLAQDTHKFESRYLDTLIGKYPEERALWIARSPLNSVEKIKSPVIIFQGENDPIVPKNQSVLIYEALKKSGVKTEIYIYPDEEHGFKHPANNIDSMTREVKFYLDVFK